MATTEGLSTITNEQRAQIIREERDALVLAWLASQITDLTGVERFLNRRINDLGVGTLTGDTTE